MLIRHLSSLFDLSSVRARSLMRSALFLFAFVAGVTALKSATNALVLARNNPRSLPYLYLATAFAITLATVYVGRRLAASGAKPILRMTVDASAILLALLGILAAYDFRPALTVLYVVGEVYATAISVLFWARLGEIFDVRTAKRIFGTIAAAGMAGAVVGGLVVRGVSKLMPNATWSWCFFAVLSLVLIRPLLGRDRGSGAIHRPRISFKEGLTYAAVDPFPRGIAILVLLLSMQTAAVDYVFRTEAFLAEHGDEAALAGLFGILNAVVGVAAIVVQVFFTAPLLRRLGVFIFLSIIPAVSIGAAGWSAAMPAYFLPVFLLKTFEMMGSLSLNQPGLQLLYNPMPSTARDSVRALVDGAIKKLGAAAGGILLILFGSLLDHRELLAMVVTIAVLLLLWLRTLKPAYLDALEAKLGGRGASSGLPIDPSDRATKEQLIKALHDTDPGKVLAALAVLDRDPKFDLRPHIIALIAHSAESVRIKAIEAIAETPDPAYAPLLVSVIQRDGKGPKAQAAKALELVDPREARRVLTPFLHALDQNEPNSDFGFVCACIAALLSPHVRALGDDDATTLAERTLMQMLNRGYSVPTAERREVARLLGLLGGDYANHLATYLDDIEPSVRLAAVNSAGIAKHPSLPSRLIPRLRDRTQHTAVRDALAAYGNDILPLLAETLDDRRLDLSLRVQIPRILRQIGTEEAAEAMLFSNVHDDAFLRYVIVEELTRMRRTNADLKFHPQRTEEAALRRLRAYTHYRPIAYDLANAPPAFGLLRRAVEDRVRQNLEAGLRLLGLLSDLEVMENAIRGFLRRDVTSRADAVELVDVALQGNDVRKKVLEYLEWHGRAAQGPLDRAFQLVESRDVQLAMVAWETLRRGGYDPPEVREPSMGEPLMPKSILDRVFLLEGVQLFHGLSVDDLAAVAGLTTEGHAAPGEIIYRQGDIGDSLYVIISGEVQLLRQSKLLMDLSPGDSFGQVSILDRGPRPVSARAGDEGVDYLVLERASFMDLVSDRPAVANGLFTVLARRLRDLLDLTGDAPTDNRATVVAPSSIPELARPT